jgi:nucleotide-binding universal stress UspA family protein
MQMKVLLAIDGSEYTKRMLSYIAAHNELLGQGHEYHVLTVVPPVPQYAARFLERSTLDGFYAEQAEVVLKPVRAFAAQQQWRAEMVYLHGHPAETIAAYAASIEADLIVMGTHGHSALTSAVLGSVASGVLARCAKPVLLVH